MTEFEPMDSEAGVLAPLAPRGRAAALVPGGVKEFRDGLVQEYHGGETSLIGKLEKENRNDVMSLAVELLKEMVGESDHLLGNELVATQNGELRDASVISFKRAEVLEKAIKATQARMKFERENNGFDLDSPAMIVVFRFFMGKVKEVFSQIGVDVELSDVFFQQLGEGMEDWKKELREQIEIAGGSATGV